MEIYKFNLINEKNSKNEIKIIHVEFGNHIVKEPPSCFHYQS